MSSVTITAPRKLWLFNPRVDLLFILGPFLTGYALLFAHYSLGIASLSLWWFWNISMNGPHLIATLFRTLLDREGRKEYRAVIFKSFGWYFLGPLSLLLSVWWGKRIIFDLFWAFQLAWAYFHVARQHYGFAVLYQMRDQTLSVRQMKIDSLLFHALFLLPFPIWFENAVDLSPTLGGMFVDAFLLTLVLFLGNEVQKYRSGKRINFLRLIYVIAYVSLPVIIAFNLGGFHMSDIYLLNVVLTYPHNIQYLAIVWFYFQGRETQGSLWKHHLPAYLACALLLGAIYYYAGWYLTALVVPFSIGSWSGASEVLGESFKVGDLIALFWQGFIFQHYYLDQKIWRLRKDSNVTKALRV